MFEMVFENEQGNKLTFGNGSDFTITEFSGLNPPKATINTNESALVDGGTFNSSKVQMRSMNIAFAVERDAAKNRLEIYKVVQNKKPIKVYYKSEVLDIWIAGWVESTDFTYWATKNVCTVSILCPEPYFKSAQEIINVLSTVIPKFHFPFGSLTEEEIYQVDEDQGTIEYHPEYGLIFGLVDAYTSIEVPNDGYIEAGLTFDFYCEQPVSNPRIIDYISKKWFKLNISMLEGDHIIVTTGQGNKKAILKRNNVETNIFNLIDPGSTWLQLPPGGSLYVYEVGTGTPNDLRITISHYDLYGGV